MPRLTKLRLLSRRLLHAPLPPQIETLELEFPQALVGGAPMPAVTEVILPFVHSRAPWREYAELLHPHRFPGLRRLDFETNEGHLGDVLAALEHLEAIERLSWLRLPSLRVEGVVRRVRDLLERAPDLAIEIARSHRPLQHLVPTDEPRIRVPDPVPNEPSDAMEGGESFLVVSIPGWNRRFEFYMPILSYNTEECYAQFSSEQQAALSALWDRIPTLGARPVGFPAAAMERVAETMMLTDCDAQIGVEPWEELLKVLRQSPCSVTIARRR
jgi:hypothetical protein